MSFFNNYWKETSRSVKKTVLILHGLVIVLSLSAYIQKDLKTGFFILLAGMVLDMLLQLLPPDASGPSNTGGAILNKTCTLVTCTLLLMLFLCSCSVIKPGVDTIKTDSTSITYKPVNYNIKGATVYKSLNADSLIKDVLITRDQYKTDSSLNAAAMAKYKQDSTAAIKSGRTVPEAPVLINPKPVIQYVTDPQSKARLSYWIDAAGKIQLGCESKDQTIQTLQAQITDLKSQVITKTVVVTKTPGWNWAAMAVEGVLLLICAIILLIKIIL